MAQVLLLTLALVLLSAVPSNGRPQFFAKTPMHDSLPPKYEQNRQYCALRTSVVKLRKDYDFTPVFNKLMQRLSSEGGGTMMLEAGTYNVTDVIEVPSTVCVKGAGMDRTLIVRSAGAPVVHNTVGIRTVRTNFVTLAHFTYVGDLYNDGAIRQPQGKFRVDGFLAHRSSYLLLEGVKMMQNSGSGFDLRGAEGFFANQLVLWNCYAISNHLHGISIRRTKFVTISGGRAVYNLANGVHMADSSSGIQIHNFYLRAQTGNNPKSSGFKCMNVSNVEFVRCQLDSYSGRSIDVVSSTGVEIRDSKVRTENGGYCRWFWHSKVVEKRNTCARISGPHS